MTRTTMPDTAAMKLMRTALIGAVLGPPVAALTSFGWAPQQFGKFWDQPLSATCFAAALCVAIQMAVLGIEFLAGDCRGVIPLRKAVSLGLIGFLSILLLAAVVFLLVGLTGMPIKGKSGVQSFAAVSGFVGITTLLTSAANGLFNATDLKRDRLRAEARIRTLEMQINPHFFFNTLNTISATIPDQPAKAQEVIGELAELFRYTMKNVGAELVPLEDEIHFVGRYLAIEQVRFGRRLQYILPGGTLPKNLRVPALSLQPLVENAVRHGIARRMEGGEVRVTVEPRGNLCLIEVSNPVEASECPHPDKFFQPGHALAITRERLTLLYPQAAARIEVECIPGLVRVRLVIPSRTE